MRRAEWEALKPGDVVKFDDGRTRTVVHVGRGPAGQIRHIVFPIKRCSWTRYGLTYADVWTWRRKAVRVVGHRQIRGLLARLVADAESNKPGTSRPGFSCCDVIGVLE